MHHFNWIQRHAERTPDKLALVDASTGREYTYGQFNQRSVRLASFLQATLGIERGDRVSILAKNSSDYSEVLMACGKMGAILNTLNWRLVTPELEHSLQDCDPRVLIYEPEFAPAVPALRNKIGVESYIRLEAPSAGESQEIGAGDMRYKDALAAGNPADLHTPSLTYDDIWAILYTSGTTGRPKGAQVTYGNFFYNAVGMGQAIDLTSQDVNLNVLPTFHSGGLGLYAGPIFHVGGTLIVMRAFDAAEALSLIENWRVSVILLVPAVYLMLEQFPEFESYDLSSVRSWASGGSALPPCLVERFAERGIIIQQGFGMTETGPTAFIIDREHAVSKAGSVGKPVLHTEVQILDREGKRLGPDEVGELCVRGGSVTTRYWNRPEATTEALVEGWLHTGDAARYVTDGFYFIVDRWKDMYIPGGENVYPAEVENVIYEHPAVAEVAVIGVPHPKWQEEGKAIVVIIEGHTLTGEQVIVFCQDKLARFKIPRTVAFTDALPRTAAEKVLKRELKERHA
jgi:fatty-acyl-CoA synthase